MEGNQWQLSEDETEDVSWKIAKAVHTLPSALTVFPTNAVKIVNERITRGLQFFAQSESSGEFSSFE